MKYTPLIFQEFWRQRHCGIKTLVREWGTRHEFSLRIHRTNIYLPYFSFLVKWHRERGEKLWTYWGWLNNYRVEMEDAFSEQVKRCKDVVSGLFWANFVLLIIFLLRKVIISPCFLITVIPASLGSWQGVFYWKVFFKSGEKGSYLKAWMNKNQSQNTLIFAKKGGKVISHVAFFEFS